MARYSQGFKNSVLLRILPPQNQSVLAVARETGIADQTLPLMTMSDNIKFSSHKNVKGKDYEKYDNYDAM
jgi:hypothetical protein